VLGGVSEMPSFRASENPRKEEEEEEKKKKKERSPLRFDGVQDN
jgi:hypothetical protein